MEFKYSLSLFMSNMGYMLKVLLWVIICVLLIAAIGVAVIVPTTQALAEGTALEEAYNTLRDDISSFISGQSSWTSLVANFTAGMENLTVAIAESVELLVAIIFICLALYILLLFLVGLVYYPIAYIAKQLMSSNMRMGLASSMVVNLKNAAKFSGARLLIVAPLNIVIVVIIILIAVGLWSYIGIFSLTLALAFGVVAFALVTTLLAGWLPRLIFNGDETMLVAFARSIRGVKLNFRGYAKAFIITFFLSYLLVATCAIPTVGLVVIVVPATNFVFFRFIELVGYYKQNGLSFYTDAVAVVNCVEFGYREENQIESEDLPMNSDLVADHVEEGKQIAEHGEEGGESK